MYDCRIFFEDLELLNIKLAISSPRLLMQSIGDSNKQNHEQTNHGYKCSSMPRLMQSVHSC